MDSNCAVEELSVSLQSCEPFCVADYRNSMIAPDVEGTGGLVGAMDSISIVESSVLRGDEEKDDAELNGDLEMKCHEITCSHPQRNVRTSKLNQKAQSNKAVRKRERKTIKKPLLDTMLLNVARKRRTYLFKTVHSSVWGSLGNITQLFIQNLPIDVDQKKHTKPQGGRCVQGCRNKNKEGKSSLSSNRKICASTGHIRLKVKLGKGPDQNGLTELVCVRNNVKENYWANNMETPQLTDLYKEKVKEDMHGIAGNHTRNGKPEKAIVLSDKCCVDACLENKDRETSSISEKSVLISSDNHQGIHSLIEVETLGVAADNQYLDPGTSPDSEVINLTPDTQVDGKAEEDLHHVQISSQACVALEEMTDLHLPQLMGKYGKKDHVLPQACNCCVDSRLPSPEIINKAILLEKQGQKEEIGDFSYGEACLSTNVGNMSGNTSSGEEFCKELLSSSRLMDSGGSCGDVKVQSDVEADLCCGRDIGPESTDSNVPKKLLVYAKGRKHSKSPESRIAGKSGPEVTDSMNRQKGNAFRWKGNRGKSVNKRKMKEEGNHNQDVWKIGNHQETGHHSSEDLSKAKNSDESAIKEMQNSDMVPSDSRMQCLSPRIAWVCCDDCLKWRRIPATLADFIEETNCRWTCKENMDQDYADCSVPQEKSNAEINAELEISDASCGEDPCDTLLNSKRLEQKQSTAPQQTSWMLIKSNLFLHRSRKSQTIDEIMVCHCKSHHDGRMGCGDGCLNRMLNIECVQGTCPCGELCSNQQFQKRIYAKLKWFRCGKKGYGLQAVEDISSGQFLTEYVGEVLDMHAYEARQREYASKGHKHFYFMTLNGSEVIDACAKGNLGRFINHSCEPNCRTEKWMVNGEVCIGLFALRDIKKGEEVTFDYNYVRVFGAAAKKCVCGSSQCRGYIGGDPANAEVIVQDDSDEEYPEPVMVYKEDEIDDDLRNLLSATGSFDGFETQTINKKLEIKDKVDRPKTVFGELTTSKPQKVETLLKDKDEIHESVAAVESLKITIEKIDISKTLTSGALSKMENSMEKWPGSGQLPDTLSQQDKSQIIACNTIEEVSVGGTFSDHTCPVQSSETSSLTAKNSEPFSETRDTKKNWKSDINGNRGALKLHAQTKTSRSSSSVKKGKLKGNFGYLDKSDVVAKKSQLLPCKTKKLMSGSFNSRFEAVEEKLNELLNMEGGISKRKDATKGYLKLLLLTAASGYCGSGEATIQSNRDLSMILDALLKTKSRMVLVDIINKNGLQMLHNIMKRYTREFNKIPILRKLLKVLEYLAAREILTLEHINGGPPRPGVESFRESILLLTEHDDKQVHQIARNFRDRWIPKPVRKISCINRSDGWMEHQGSNCNRYSLWPDLDSRTAEAHDNKQQSVLVINPIDAGTREACSVSRSSSCLTSGMRIRKRKSRWDQPAETNPAVNSHEVPQIQHSISQNSIASPQAKFGADDRVNMDEDVPPGFSRLVAGPSVPSDISSIVTDIHKADGRPAKWPGVVMGQPQGRFISRFPVSYGIPFPVVLQLGTPQAERVGSWAIAPGMPFHPFPPLPPCPLNKREHPLCPAARNYQATSQAHQQTPISSGAGPSDLDVTSAKSPPWFQRARDSYDLGKRYFRQKYNNSKLAPPWIRKRNGRGFGGNNSRNGMRGIGVGNVTNEFEVLNNSTDITTRAESACSSFHQCPEQQN